jgi:hypothetical protein
VAVRNIPTTVKKSPGAAICDKTAKTTAVRDARQKYGNFIK